MTRGYEPRWDIDLASGEQAERFWRWFMDVEPGRVEIKRKRNLNDLLYIELEQNPRREGLWKPSGLNVTQADWWVFVIGDSFMAIVLPVPMLRWAVTTGAARETECPDGDNPTKGVLLRVGWLIQESGRWFQGGVG